MKKLSNFLMPLCIFIASVCGAQEINQVNCDGSTLVDFSTATIPDFNLDDDHPFTGPTAFFEMEVTNMYTEFSTSSAGGLNLIDTQIWVFQKDGFGWDLREYNDNNSNAGLGYSYTFLKSVVGKELLIAVGANNANGSSCMLNTTSCKPVQAFDLSITSRNMVLEQTYQPEGSVGIGLIDVPESSSTSPYNYDVFTFSGTGDEMTLSFEPLQAVTSTYEYVVARYEGGLWLSIANGEFFPNAPFDVLFETEFASTYHLVIQANGYNVFSGLENKGTFAEEGIAVTLSNEFNTSSDLGSFFNPWQLNEGDYVQSSVTRRSVDSPDDIGCWPNSSREHYYQLDGNGSTRRLVFSGGTLEIGQNESEGSFGISGPSIIQYLARFTIFTLNAQNEMTCVYDEYDVFVDVEVLLATNIGETYYIRVSDNANQDYSIYLGSEEEQSVNYFEDNARRVFCGEDTYISAVIDEQDDQVKTLFSNCGSTIAHPRLNVLKYLADGDPISMLIPPTDGLSGEIRIMERIGNSFTCTSGPHLILGDGSLNLAMATTDQTEYIIVANLLADEEPRTDFQLFSQNCVPCAGVYGGIEYPGDLNNEIIQQVIGEIPGCCTLGWFPACQDDFNERVMDAHSASAEQLQCGIHNLTLRKDELSRAYGPYSVDGIELGNGDLVYSFISTGEEMTVSWEEVYGQTAITVFTNNGDYQTHGSINSEQPVTFTLPQGTEAYVIVAGFVLEGLGSSIGTLTITDANQCGVCDVVFNNEVSLPTYDVTFDAVVNLNSSCCSAWTESCQNLYNVFSFPSCFTAVEASCGDVLSGDTTGDPFYQEYRCNEDEFTSPADWYTFTGDGKTWVVEAIDDFTSELNTQLHVYSGDCPKLTCEASDSSSGEFDDAKLSIPTIVGETYYIAVTGENGDEGSYTLEFRTDDYCGMCYTEYSNQHGYDVSNQIYQSVIAENPSCCSSFWDFGCDQLYNSYICAFAAEPNNSLFDAAYMGSFGEDNCSIIQQASVDKQSDSDFYQISINQSGSLSIDLNSIALQPDLNIRLTHNNLEVDISNNEFSSFEFIEHEVNVPGTYYIEVYAAENANFSMNECYDLTVNWQSEVITCTLNVELEDEGDCNPEDGSWDFDIEITANNVGGSTWLINGEEFPISNQIEVFTLTNFTPNGEMQNLQVQVKENPACQVFLPNFVVAPQPCLVAGNACPFDSNGDDEINATDLLAFLGAFGTQCSE